MREITQIMVFNVRELNALSCVYFNHEKPQTRDTIYRDELNQSDARKKAAETFFFIISIQKE
jgi:hypothetical protein